MVPLRPPEDQDDNLLRVVLQDWLSFEEAPVPSFLINFFSHRLPPFYVNQSPVLPCRNLFPLGPLSYYQISGRPTSFCCCGRFQASFFFSVLTFFFSVFFPVPPFPRVEAPGNSVAPLRPRALLSAATVTSFFLLYYEGSGVFFTPQESVFGRHLRRLRPSRLVLKKFFGLPFLSENPWYCAAVGLFRGRLQEDPLFSFLVFFFFFFPYSSPFPISPLSFRREASCTQPFGV